MSPFLNVGHKHWCQMVLPFSPPTYTYCVNSALLNIPSSLPGSKILIMSLRAILAGDIMAKGVSFSSILYSCCCCCVCVFVCLSVGLCVCTCSFSSLFLSRSIQLCSMLHGFSDSIGWAELIFFLTCARQLTQGSKQDFGVRCTWV